MIQRAQNCNVSTQFVTYKHLSQSDDDQVVETFTCMTAPQRKTNAIRIVLDDF